MATDSLGVDIVVGDLVRITSWGGPVRLYDVGRIGSVAGFTPRGNVVLDAGGFGDAVANGRAIPPAMLGVLRRDGAFDGYEANIDLYTKAGS